MMCIALFTHCLEHDSACVLRLINMQCVQKIKNRFPKICIYAFLIQMLMLTAFGQIATAQIDSNATSAIAISKGLDSSISQQINNISSKDKQIGKLPFKRSQLPELFLVILLLSVVAILRYFFPRYLPELSHQYFSLSADARVLKNDRIADMFPSIFYDALYILLGTSYILYFAKHIYMVTNTFRIYNVLIIGISLIAYLAFKTYFIKILSWVYKFSPTSNIVLAYGVITRHIIAIILVGAIAFLLLINPVGISKLGLYLSFILASTAYLFYVLKMTVFVKKMTSVSFFDIFIYLCTIEILPLSMIITFYYRLLTHSK
jgi:hypothetical protein